MISGQIAQPPSNDAFVDELLRTPESTRFEIRRVIGDKLTRALETIVAFSNREGGFLVLGIEDERKVKHSHPMKLSK